MDVFVFEGTLFGVVSRGNYKETDHLGGPQKKDPHPDAPPDFYRYSQGFIQLCQVVQSAGDPY